MQTDKAKIDAEAMAAELKEGKAFQESAGKHEVSVKHTGLFKRSAVIPDIGSDPKFAEAAFQLTSTHSTSQQPVQGTAGVYLMRLSERKGPEPRDFETEKEGIKSSLLRQKQRTVFQDWIASRKSDSKIVIEEAYLE
jgi:peptidyl-prolyl cis-trans isomerase D